MSDIDLEQEKKGALAILKEDITRKAFYAFLYSVFMSIASIVFLNINQAYIIRDLLKVSAEDVGNTSGNLVLADELLSLLLVSPWGALSDQIGRRWLFSSGLLFMGASNLIIPSVKMVYPGGGADLFSSLLFARLVFAAGASACTAMITACIGDFAAAERRSRVAGIVGFVSGLGAIFGAFGFSRLYVFARHAELAGLRERANGGVNFMFVITGIIQILSSIIPLFFLIIPALDDNPGDKLNLVQRIKTGIVAMRNPLVCLAYASGYVARADSIAISLFISPWVLSHMERTGGCPPEDVSNLNWGHVQCPPAKSRSSSLSGVSNLVMLFGAPLFGVLSDRFGPIKTLIIPSILGSLCFFLLGTVLSNPESTSVYIAFAVAGMADIGMIITSMAVMAQVSCDRNRGALAGVYSFFGALGIIVTAKLGGLLYAAQEEHRSFLAVAAPSTLIAIVASAFIYFKADK